MRKLERNAVSGIMLILLLIGMSTLALDIQPVRASGTIYIRADGSVDPDTAPISSVDNVTYTFTDNIYDSIVVERDNIVVDGAGYTVQGTHTYDSGIYLTGRNNVTIKNMKIKAFYRGIWLKMSSSNSITGNDITGNPFGISLDDSSNYNTVSGNNITNNSIGIGLQNSSNNSISGNNITANGNGGIDVRGASNNNRIYGNNITANTLYGVGLFLSSNYNTVSGNNITNSDFGGSLSSSNYNTVSENNITNSYSGVSLGSSNYNTVSGNHITNNNYYGICLSSSSNNVFRNNSMADNLYNIGVWGESLSVFVNDVDVSNTVDGKPVYYWINRRDEAVPLDAGYVALINCTNITVQNLKLTKCLDGVLLAYTTDSTITKNNITNNWHGIWLYRSSGNIISGNNITNNRYGVCLYYSSNNNFYHNNFIDNTHHSPFIYSPGYANFWDDGYPSGGNYWSDYTGVDEFGGPNQDEPGADGIIDTPYTIDADNQDNYPLTKPYGGAHDIGITRITPSETLVELGSKLDINITVLNRGFYTETFNLTAYASTTVINKTEVTLSSRNSATITFTWDTAGVTVGTYTLKAQASTVPGETHTTDNTFIDGQVTLNIHDIAVIQVTVAPASVKVGETVHINVTVANQGSMTETFDVSTYYNTSSIETKTGILLNAGESITLEFSWNTTSATPGNYSISAYTTPVPNEIDTADNYFEDGVVSIVTPENLTQRLIETIETWNLPEGTETGLSMKLEEAFHLLELGQETGAIHKLLDFDDLVEALREKKLTNEQADYLISEAQKIIDLIEE